MKLFGFAALAGWFSFLVACSAPVTTPSPLSIPPTLALPPLVSSLLNTPTPECNVAEFVTATSATMEHFADIEKRAGQTSRIALSPVIGEMQEVRRTYRAVAAPPCAQHLHDLMVEAMELYIESYLAFMGQQADAAVQAYLNDADAKLREGLRETTLLTQYDVAGLTRPTPPPTNVPLPSTTHAPRTPSVRFFAPGSSVRPAEIGTPLANVRMRVCNIDAAPVQTTPAFSNDRLTYLDKGIEIAVYGRVGDWWFIGVDETLRPAYVANTHLCK